MPVIVPRDLEATGFEESVLADQHRCIPKAFNSLYTAWDQLQVSHHGVYTGRRARALERYLSSTSLPRVLAACILTPLPILAFVLLQELVPLDAPQPGWRANYRWFIRSTAIFMVLTLSYIRQGVIFLAPLKVSKKQALVITVSTTAAYFIVLVAVSTYWIFPIPFACVLTTGVFTIVFFGLFVAVIGWRTLTNTPRLSAHARIFKGVFAVEPVILLVYPAFNAVFQMLHGIQQLAFLSVLFLLKVAMRFIVAYALRRSNGGLGVEERWRARLPEVVVFSTELFHVLYLTACLQGQHITLWGTVGLALFDSIGSMISVHSLLGRPSMAPFSNRLSQIGPTKHSLRAILPLAAPSNSRSRSFMRLPTINSASSFRLSSRRLSNTVSLSTSRRLSMALSARASNLKLAKRSSSGSSIHSNVSASRSPPTVECQIIEPIKLTTQDIAVEMSRLETFSMVEYFLLDEYVKCIIPAMYGIFQVVLSRLPNAIYYPSIAKAIPLELYRTQTRGCVCVVEAIFSNGIHDPTPSTIVPLRASSTRVRLGDSS